MDKRKFVQTLKRRFWNNRRTARGDTIVEVVIVAAIMALVLVGAFASTAQSTRNVRDTQERQQAAALASTQIEWIVANQGLPGEGTQCFDDQGTPTHNTDDTRACNFDTDSISNCLPTRLGYCYNVVITSQSTTNNGYTSTTYKVTITWERLGGGRNTTAYFYRIPIDSPSNSARRPRRRPGTRPG